MQRLATSLLVVMAVCLDAVSASNAPESVSTPEPVSPARNFGWVCQSADGTFISGHPQQDHAQASCSYRAKTAPGGIFIVVAGKYDAVLTSVPQPVALKSPDCQPPQGCPANLPMSGQRGSWSWVPPARLENGNILTDLSRFVMYRQVMGDKPEVFAEIDGKATNLFWGMDTRDANACFWIVAVRINSAAMPSDKSNTVCMDAQGQPLPKT